VNNVDVEKLNFFFKESHREFLGGWFLSRKFSSIISQLISSIISFASFQIELVQNLISYREQKIQLLYIKIFYINTLLSFSALPVDNANDYTDDPPWPRFCNKRRFNSKPTHHLFWNDQTTSSTLSEEQLVKKSGLLCLRLFVHPSTNELNELKDHTLYSNPKWLGLLLVDGKFGHDHV